VDTILIVATFQFKTGSPDAYAAPLLALVLVLCGCGKPVPPEKSSYVGEWQHPTMYLLLTQDGSVRYKRIQGGVTTSVDGPLKGFQGNNFEVGIGANEHRLRGRKATSRGRWQVENGRRWRGTGSHFKRPRLVHVKAPNPSIERTVTSGLRPLVTAAHVKR
jgi:hypothetical protein